MGMVKFLNAMQFLPTVTPTFQANGLSAKVPSINLAQLCSAPAATWAAGAPSWTWVTQVRPFFSSWKVLEKFIQYPDAFLGDHLLKVGA